MPSAAVKRKTTGAGSNSTKKAKKGDSGKAGVPSREKSDPRRWTKAEDDALRAAVKRGGEKNWKSIAVDVKGRNHTQCLQRWTKVLKPGLVKGHWTEPEDKLLTKMVLEDPESQNLPKSGPGSQNHKKPQTAESSAVMQLAQQVAKKHPIASKAKTSLVPQNSRNWGYIAGKIAGRTSKQCRERWCNHLDPSINKGAYNSDEDALILDMQAKLGNRWSLISNYLQGRTEDAVKIRWKSLQRARLGGTAPPNGATKIKTNSVSKSKKKTTTASENKAARANTKVDTAAQRKYYRQKPSTSNAKTTASKAKVKAKASVKRPPIQGTTNGLKGTVRLPPASTLTPTSARFAAMTPNSAINAAAAAIGTENEQQALQALGNMMMARSGVPNLQSRDSFNSSRPSVQPLNQISPPRSTYERQRALPTPSGADEVLAKRPQVFAGGKESGGPTDGASAVSPALLNLSTPRHHQNGGRMRSISALDTPKQEWGSMDQTPRTMLDQHHASNGSSLFGGMSPSMSFDGLGMNTPLGGGSFARRKMSLPSGFSEQHEALEQREQQQHASNQLKWMVEQAAEKKDGKAAPTTMPPSSGSGNSWLTQPSPMAQAQSLYEKPKTTGVTATSSFYAPITPTFTPTFAAAFQNGTPMDQSSNGQGSGFHTGFTPRVTSQGYRPHTGLTPHSLVNGQHMDGTTPFGALGRGFTPTPSNAGALQQGPGGKSDARGSNEKPSWASAAREAAKLKS